MSNAADDRHALVLVAGLLHIVHLLRDKATLTEGNALTLVDSAVQVTVRSTEGYNRLPRGAGPIADDDQRHFALTALTGARSLVQRSRTSIMSLLSFATSFHFNLLL